MHSDSQCLNSNLSYNEGLIRKKWLYSFFAYYGYCLLFFFFQVFFDSVGFYDCLIWTIRFGIYFLIYKRFYVYVPLLLTSLVPLVLFMHLPRITIEINSAQLSIEMCLLIVQLLLFIFFLYNSYLLLNVNEKREQGFYDGAVKHLWTASLLFYFGLYSLQEVHCLKNGWRFDFAKGLGIVAADLTFIILFYYFAVKKRGTFVLLALVFFIPKPWFGKEYLDLSLWSKIAWIGFFSSFCICTYRLYKVNKKYWMAKRKEDKKENIGIQQSA